MPGILHSSRQLICSASPASPASPASRPARPDLIAINDVVAAVMLPLAKEVPGPIQVGSGVRTMMATLDASIAARTGTRIVEDSGGNGSKIPAPRPRYHAPDRSRAPPDRPPRRYRCNLGGTARNVNRE